MSEMLESEVEITEISVQISVLERKKEELVLREEKKKDDEVWLTYNRNSNTLVWKYVSFIFKPESLEAMKGN